MTTSTPEQKISDLLEAALVASARNGIMPYFGSTGIDVGPQFCVLVWRNRSINEGGLLGHIDDQEKARIMVRLLALINDIQESKAVALDAVSSETKRADEAEEKLATLSNPKWGEILVLVQQVRAARRERDVHNRRRVERPADPRRLEIQDMTVDELKKELTSWQAIGWNGEEFAG